MLDISYKNQFKRELDLQKKRGKNLSKFLEVAKKLCENIPLEEKYRAHKLRGEFHDRWECHIEPDWLIIYRKTDTSIVFERTGSHSDLF